MFLNSLIGLLSRVLVSFRQITHLQFITHVYSTLNYYSHLQNADIGVTEHRIG